ncbi:DUF1524 domain-containing protein [Jonesiaceae bacterium BS-20]|uniref:DUF1524 domain-containing protein n=1 Tax=Jonesiaceae bacterium BS-20 TaxID=3120821 RepID=A0AAU7DWF0_9MICO
MFCAPFKRPRQTLGAAAFVLALLLSGCTSPAASETVSPPVAPSTAPAPQATANEEDNPEGAEADNANPGPEGPAHPDAGDSPVDVAVPATNYSESVSKLGLLAVKGRAPKTGYARTEFGAAWKDVDRNGCDTRNDMLRRDLKEVVYKPGTGNCKVLSGVLADPFTGTTINFDSANDPSGVQIDHVVALSDAWQKGAQQLTLEQRTEFANDPMNLLAVQGAANQQKSDGDAATWLPKNKGFRCQFVAIQIDVKAKYGLWVTSAEHDVMANILQGCSGPIEVTGQNSLLDNDTTQVAPVPKDQSATTGNPGGGATAPPAAGVSQTPGAKDASAGVAPASKTACPADAPIKGNQTKKAWIYHVEGESGSYKATHPERCFATADDALQAGYRAPLN